MSLVSGYPQHFGPAAEAALHSAYFSPAARYDPSNYSPLAPAPAPDTGHYFAWPFHSSNSPQSPEPSPTGSSDYSPPPPYTPSPSGHHHSTSTLHQVGPAHQHLHPGAAATPPSHPHHPSHHPFASATGGDLVVGPSSEGSIRPVRAVKRRVTANRKERRRTQFINSAFAKLRGCIPHVPADTKLSKIKTLRLATSYIAYLMDVLAQDDPVPEGGFKAELVKKLESAREQDRRKRAADTASSGNMAAMETPCAGNTGEKKSKGRTGWPQHVWALELKHDPR